MSIPTKPSQDSMKTNFFPFSCSGAPSFFPDFAKRARKTNRSRCGCRELRSENQSVDFCSALRASLARHDPECLASSETVGTPTARYLFGVLVQLQESQCCQVLTGRSRMGRCIAKGLGASLTSYESPASELSELSELRRFWL